MMTTYEIVLTTLAAVLLGVGTLVSINGIVYTLRFASLRGPVMSLSGMVVGLMGVMLVW